MQPPPIPKQQRGPSRTAIGCGVVASLFLIGIVALVVWLVARPRVRVDVAAVAGPDAVAVLHLRDLRRDPGTIQMLQQVQDLQAEALREQLEQELPPGMGVLGRITLGMERMNRLSSAAIPEIVVAIEPGQGTNVVEVVAAGRIGGMGRLMLGFVTGTMGFAANRSGHSVTYRGRKYMDLGEAFLSSSRGTVLFATYQDGMEAMIDRLVDGAPVTSLVERLAPPEGDSWDLVLMGENRQGLFGHAEAFLRELDEKDEDWDVFPAHDGVEWGWIGLDIHTGDWIRGRMRLGYRDATAAAEGAEAWRPWLESRLDRLRDEGLAAMLTVRQEGTDVRIDLDLTQVEQAMREAFRNAIKPSSWENGEWEPPDWESP